MFTYDIGIIGAGPSGISCAIKAARKGKKVVIVECGKDYQERCCAVDHGGECQRCKFCNVISGFGGCIHYGDSAKLSYYPSGKQLYEKLSDEYDRIRDEACQLWEIDSKEFLSCLINTDNYNFNVKEYPVYVANCEEIKETLKRWKEQLDNLDVEYIHGQMENFRKDKNIFSVSLTDRRVIYCNKLVLAMGRQGLKWFKDNLQTKSIEYIPPISSIGFRFEMPKEYLVETGKLHPDFKARTKCNNIKYKTFCFCAGVNGGRLKFANYGEYTLLDGHILTECDAESQYGNFALLRQVILNDESLTVDYNTFIDSILEEYKRISKGRPIYQRYIDFKNMVDSDCDIAVSVAYVKKGPVYRLFQGDLKEYCTVAEQIFTYLANVQGISLEEFISNVNVVGLELEGLWDKIVTDANFMTNVEGLHVVGDCGGEAQGIIQAMMMGIKVAESLTGSSCITHERQ